MHKSVLTAAAVLLAAQATSAYAAYSCELFDRAPNAPGGNIPALIKYTDSTDVEASKAACSGLVDQVNYVDYWLKWMDARSLPINWQASDLFAGAEPTRPAPVTNDGYACIIYDSQSDVPFETFYVTKNEIADLQLKVDDITQQCKAVMRYLLPDHYRDFEVKYLKELPARAADKLLFAQGC